MYVLKQCANNVVCYKAQWSPLGEERLTRYTVYVYIFYFPNWFLGNKYGSDCRCYLSLLMFYIRRTNTRLERIFPDSYNTFYDVQTHCPFLKELKYLHNFNFHDFLTAIFLRRVYRYHKLCKAFSKFYRKLFELIEKYHVSLKKTLVQQGISNPDFCGNMVYIF